MRACIIFDLVGLSAVFVSFCAKCGFDWLVNWLVRCVIVLAGLLGGGVSRHCLHDVREGTVEYS